MINDLPGCFTSTAALFADDLCFWEVGTNVHELNGSIQTSLNKIATWCKYNGLISIPKSSAMLFSKKQKRKTFTFI